MQSIYSKIVFNLPQEWFDHDFFNNKGTDKWVKSKTCEHCVIIILVQTV